MNMRILSAILCSGVLFASPVWADVTVTADFTDGNYDTDFVDAFHGIAGGGWTTPWVENYNTTLYTATNTVLLSGDPSNQGVNDVRFAAAREHGGIDLLAPRTIEFTFRLDEDVTGTGSTFTDYQDRYMIFDSYGGANTASARATWSIFGYADTGTYCPEGRQMEWTFCSGTNHEIGNMDGATFADTNVPLVGGAIYNFSITLDTIAERWNASVSTTIDSVVYSYDSTTDYPTGMGWRNAYVAGNWLYFSSRTYGADDVRAFSVDGVSVVGAGPPGDMDTVVARFDDGNSDVAVDGYPGVRGNGWNTAWQYGASTGASATDGFPTVLATSPLKPGEPSGNYLQVDNTHTSDASYAGVRRHYKAYDHGIDWTKNHTVQFSVRIDEDLSVYFNDVDDRYQFSGEESGYNSSEGSAWLVSCFGGYDDIVASLEDVGVWVFYDGGRDGGVRDATRNVESDIAVAQGVVYDFTIVIDPETQSYVATVSNGTDEFTTGTLGWWTNATEIGGYLLFDTRAGGGVDEYNPEHRMFSLDDVVITQLPSSDIPGDADGDGYVDADDAAILAANWGTASGATWAMGDFTGEGAVNAADAAIMAANWNPDPGSESAAVPEPGMLVLCWLGLAMLAIRRRR